MARIRYIKPDFFLDEHLSDLQFKCRLAFAGLWCHADKRGRLEDSPRRLKAVIFPYDRVDMEKILSLLTKKPFITRYEVDSKKYIQIINFEKHQRPHHTEKESEIPEFNCSLTVKAPLETAGEGNGEGNGEGKGLTKRVKRQPSHDEFLETLKTNPAYQHLDITKELSKMDAWILANPHRQKTKKFVINWLNRAADQIIPVKVLAKQSNLRKCHICDKDFPDGAHDRVACGEAFKMSNQGDQLPEVRAQIDAIIKGTADKLDANKG